MSGPLAKTRQDTAEEKTGDSRPALSQGHEGVRKANPEQWQGVLAPSVGRREGSGHIPIKNGFIPRGGSAICGESESLAPTSFSPRASRVGVMSNEVTQSRTEIKQRD